MAYTSSGDLAVGSSYTLGEYVFSLTATPDPGEGTTGINVRCDKGGERARAASEVTGTIESWSVEANETVASVYVTVGIKKIRYNAQPGDVVARIAGDSERPDHYFYRTFTLIGSSPAYSVGAVTTPTGRPDGRTITNALAISDEPDGVWMHCEDLTHPEYSTDSRSSTAISYEGSTYYYNPPFNGLYMFNTVQYASFRDAVLSILPSIVETETKSVLIAQFAINLGDAGGYPGGGGGWISPGDWNPDPTTTLHLTVNGALSGRHNDPLADPGYSYLPADNTSQAGYGCGGDGGHGGGGGAGASTITIRQFATNKANNKDIVALAKRHGYGSGGGKGGKGGDGCILIYY